MNNFKKQKTKACDKAYPIFLVKDIILVNYKFISVKIEFENAKGETKEYILRKTRNDKLILNKLTH